MKSGAFCASILARGETVLAVTPFLTTEARRGKAATKG
jgi:hypothetical protein